MVQQSNNRKRFKLRGTWHKSMVQWNSSGHDPKEQHQNMIQTSNSKICFKRIITTNDQK